MVFTSTLGYPRIGANRELKKSIELYWGGKLSTSDLLQTCKKLKTEHWIKQQKEGVDFIPSNDFTLYDQVLDTCILFNAVPDRFAGCEGLELYFAMARGVQTKDLRPMEMKKWFDTNYHYIVPELSENQQFKLNEKNKVIEDVIEGKENGIVTRPVLLGPVSFLKLSKCDKGQSFEVMKLANKLVKEYEKLLDMLIEKGVEWVQFDEPILASNPDLFDHVKKAYNVLGKKKIKIMLSVYFDKLGEGLIKNLMKINVAGVHLDLVRGAEDLEFVCKHVDNKKILSLGVIDGRNIWISDLNKLYDLVDKAVQKIGSDRVVISPSCSLFLVPHSLNGESKMDKEILSWLAFADEKLKELNTLKKSFNEGKSSVENEFNQNKNVIESRKMSEKIHIKDVKDEVNNIEPSMFKRNSEFDERIKQQKEKLNLPKFPTTTIGSFPQTKEVRTKRAHYKNGALVKEEYEKFIEEQIKNCIKKQEDIGLDVVVHGEFERNDMVEYFSQFFTGVLFTENGWVQSYGTRCVKPPIIYGDVSRIEDISIKWIKFAQSLTNKPVKGMLTGPVTCLQWSFVRDDQERKVTAYQLALAIRKEVKALENNGIKIIQIDEPAIREGLPLKKEDWKEYLDWSIKAFKLASSVVNDYTQIHTHMCYSDFQDIFEYIKSMDADVLSIENSKSDLKMLNTFKEFSYNNMIGPGVYDIHSPRIPSVDEIKERVEKVVQFIDKDLLWLNPDCGLKTRAWNEVEESLKNIVEVSHMLRN